MAELAKFALLQTELDLKQSGVKHARCVAGAPGSAIFPNALDYTECAE